MYTASSIYIQYILYKFIKECKQHTMDIKQLCYTACGNYLISCGSEGNVSINHVLNQYLPIKYIATLNNYSAVGHKLHTTTKYIAIVVSIIYFATIIFTFIIIIIIIIIIVVL